MKLLEELTTSHGPDDDAFVECAFATPAQLRRVADDWERAAPVVAEAFIRARKAEGDDLRQQIENAAHTGDEDRLRELCGVRARTVLGIITQREIRTEIARQLSGSEAYTNPMRCALELMI